MSIYEIALRWMSRNTFDDKSRLVQVMVYDVTLMTADLKRLQTKKTSMIYMMQPCQLST